MLPLSNRFLRALLGPILFYMVLLSNVGATVTEPSPTCVNATAKVAQRKAPKLAQLAEYSPKIFAEKYESQDGSPALSYLDRVKFVANKKEAREHFELTGSIPQKYFYVIGERPANAEEKTWIEAFHKASEGGIFYFDHNKDKTAFVQEQLINYHKVNEIRSGMR